MNEKQLSQRLEAVARYIPEASRLADIGSDHAYLPVFLALQDKIIFAIAGEVVAGPYHSAEKQVSQAGLKNKISVRLGDGLEVIHPSDRIDAVSICGMGGQLICSILEAGFRKNRLTGSERLILQPNVQAEQVRKWLAAHDYAILNEEILEEDEKIYEIMVAEKNIISTKEQYTQAELYFGPFLLKEKNQAFVKKWTQEKEQLQKVVNQLKQAKTQPIEKTQECMNKVKLIEEVLND